ncbi:MAG TPA: glycerol-3-phosphate dehydrogenase/oxidase [Acidimicrobiales bacterium]|nr:glycerol-3-phosphate dehydrogenase/oxidase [Acidimicrobiales bacterium]
MPPAVPDSAPGVARGTFNRGEAMKRLVDDEFDVLVIGGGITGAGVALDAASRGLRTALVERSDFATGTSSKSSKMVHGGIRYLQQRDFRLVYESLHERQRLLENAPHLVSPLPFLIPLFGRNGVVQKNVARAYSVALWLYDVTGGWRIGKRHRRVGAAEALSHLPTLRTDRLVAGFWYYDAWADDARLTLSIVRTAALDHGAVAVNYTEVDGLLRDSSGRVRGARVRALPLAATVPSPTNPTGPSSSTGPTSPTSLTSPTSQTGSSSPASPTGAFEVRARVVVNATGVWADDVRALDEERHPHSLRPAKGIHVTVPRSKLPADIAAVIPVPKDRRSIFVVPWADGEDVYIGTTDTAWDGPLDDPACLPEDVDYLIGAVNGSVSDPLSRDDVTGLWAGLRPLLAPSGGHHLSERTADLSRRHSVRSSAGGLVTVTGGKLTTYRRMAEDTVDEVVRLLGSAAPSGLRRCRTPRLRLRGAEGLAALLEPRAARAHGLDEDVFSALVRRHGSETPAVLELASGRPDLLQPLVPGLAQLRVEAIWAAREEMAVTLDDVLSRRTRSSIRRAAATGEAAGDVAELLAGEWGRSSTEVASEAKAFAEQVLGELDRAGLGAGSSAERRSAQPGRTT